MRKLYSVFNIVKLTNTFEDPILGKQVSSLPDSIIIDSITKWTTYLVIISEPWTHS